MMFGVYIEFCHSKTTAPRGRVMLALVALRFRVDRHRGNVLNQTHLFQLTLPSFKLADVKMFMDRIRFILTNIHEDDMPQKRLMYNWLFRIVKDYAPIKSKIERLRESPQGSPSELGTSCGRLSTITYKTCMKTKQLPTWNVPSLTVM